MLSSNSLSDLCLPLSKSSFFKDVISGWFVAMLIMRRFGIVWALQARRHMRKGWTILQALTISLGLSLVELLELLELLDAG